MMKKNISQLLEKFKTGLAEGKDPYFDSEEIEDLLNGISDEEAKEYLIPILDLGLRLYPFNQSLLIKRIEKDFTGKVKRFCVMYGIRIADPT